MARYEVAPTRTNLISLKADLALVHEGHELLEQKRQILVLELKQLIALAVQAQKRVDEELANAFAALTHARLACGEAAVYSAARATNIVPEIALKERRVMGVSIPGGQFALADNAPYYATQSTSVWTDEAVARFKKALCAIAELAQARIAVVRLARAIQKTIRRVNALEKLLIPDYEETVKYIQDSLEESDRQAFFNLKLVKGHLESKRSE